ncbi:hypothetical protein HYV64_01545 [Candidatus Shapirobacteria bacterium]|nr:hypothetical protein [Candidatus Shapirobacteria bacterium]
MMTVDEEKIKLAAKEIARLGKGAIKDPIEYAKSLHLRYGLDFEGRHVARQLANRMLREEWLVEVDHLIPSYLPEVRALNKLFVEIGSSMISAGTEINYFRRKITGDHPE